MRKATNEGCLEEKKNAGKRFVFSASSVFKIKLLQWKNINAVEKNKYTHVETEYMECVRLFAVRKYRSGTSGCWIGAGENEGGVNVSVKEVNEVWVENQNPWKDHRETSRALDGKSHNNSNSQEQKMETEETEEGEDTKRGTKKVF